MTLTGNRFLALAAAQAGAFLAVLLLGGLFGVGTTAGPAHVPRPAVSSTPRGTR